MKKVYFLLAFLSYTSLFSKTISVEEATIVCQNFVYEKLGESSRHSFVYADVKMTGNIPAYYRFQSNLPGFIVISASDLTSPILAYSFQYDFKETPVSNYFLDRYLIEIQYLEKNTSIQSQEANKEWAHYLSGNFVPNSSKENSSVGPLITTTWDQGKYYNTYCPWDVSAGWSYDYRVPNGCVALAMAMLMNYYRFPETGKGGISYKPQGYPRQTVDFSKQTYNYDIMCDHPEFYASEIAKLIYHCGVAVQMNYGADGSGALSTDALERLRKTFSYENAFIAGRGTYQDSTAWANRLKRELDSLRPLYYSANNGTGGHAFIVDGYDAQNLFHVNWGWGGFNNGYYRIQYLAPGGYGAGYNFNEEVILNLYPTSDYPVQCAGHVRNTASFGYITNGSTNKPYAANSNCSWMVATPEATAYTFSFSRLRTEAEQDIVTIYNGPSVESGIAGTYSGTQIPAPIWVQADSVLITFNSNATVQDIGFLIEYEADIPSQYCTPVTITDDYGEISDGSSQDENYRNQSNCTWRIEAPNASGYDFTFTEFDLGEGDFIDIYDNTSYPPSFSLRFMNSSSTRNFTCNFSKVMINFISDNWNNGEGFKLIWGNANKINEQNPLKNISVYPNPANDYLYINFSTDSPENILCKAIDMAGKTIYSEYFTVSGNNYSCKFPVSNLAPGFYLLQIETPNGKVIKKFTVN